MTLGDVRYLAAVAVCAGLVAYFSIDTELEFDKEKLETLSNSNCGQKQ